MVSSFMGSSWPARTEHSCFGQAGRLLAGPTPVAQEGFQLLDGDATVIVPRIPALHDGLVAVTKDALGQKLAVELLFKKKLLEVQEGGRQGKRNSATTKFD